MAERTVLAGGTVVTAGSVSETDVAFDGEHIVSVGPCTESTNDVRIDVRGKIVIPGAVDVHTHLDTPFMGTTTADDHISGSLAALAGGTTTFVDYAFQMPGERLPDTLQRWHDKAQDRSHADYSFHLAITDFYDGFLDDLPFAVRDGSPSFKVFMAYKGLAMVDDGQLFEILRTSARLGSTLCVHAENGLLIDVLGRDLISRGERRPLGHRLSRPPTTEVEAVHRAIAIANLADAPIYFVHLSTRGAVEALAAAQEARRPISGETCTHYLLLDDSLYHEPHFEAAKYVVSPPLRSPADRAAMWDALRDRTLGVVSSDHCPFCFKGQKELGRHDFRAIPNGIPGIEHRLILLYGKGVRAGKIDLSQMVDVACTGPAKAFGLYPRKGVLARGSDADIVVIDPEATTVILASEQAQNCDYSPFERWSVPGRVESVWLRGRKVLGTGVSATPRGTFLARSAR
jgi:dihydropyrimidinase